MASAGSLSAYDRKRDFSRTSEPRGEGNAPSDRPTFVVQLHDASRMHYDLRLETEGVLRSWAVPKGPSPDPADRRLAIETEDHPLSYGGFEGAIPEEEYGGGTVLLWDRGTFELEDAGEGSHDEAFRKAYDDGRLPVRFDGKRLSGPWMLVRTDDASGERAKWLLFAREEGGAEVPAPTRARSVASGRTLGQIAAEAEDDADALAEEADGLEPMLAVSVDSPPDEAGWSFEPKFDGIRILAFATAGAARLITRNGIDRGGDFPQVRGAAQELAREAGYPVVLDGELVAWGDGRPQRFGSLQRIRSGAEDVHAVLAVFDLLLEGEEALVEAPLRARRERLEALMKGREDGILFLSEQSDKGAPLLRRAREEGWEGIMAKRDDAPYHPGRRSADWRKIKIENRQEFVVAGFTEPTGSRQHFGSLLLGVYEGNDLRYAGRVGTGFSNEDLAGVHRRLRRLVRKTSPLAEPPSTSDALSWTTPRLVVEVRFNEWTRDGLLRQPVFEGVREDRDPDTVVRERGDSVRESSLAAVEAPRPRNKGRKKSRGGAPWPRTDVPTGQQRDSLIRRLEEIEEEEGGDGELDVPGGTTLRVSSLGRALFPDVGITKGDVMRYYVAMAPRALPPLCGRPLVLKRYPEGLAGQSFFQQKAPDHLRGIARIEEVPEGGDGTPAARLIGGDLATLLAQVQFGAISLNPWHARTGSLTEPDYTIVDMDPTPDTPFERIVEMTLRVRDEMARLGLDGAVKTSGSRGLHVYIPLPRGTPDEAARLVAQIVATSVANRHPRYATVERTVKKRPAGSVYLDYLQNVTGKSVSGVYGVRVRPGAPVSTPLSWEELEEGIDPADFTVRTVPGRVEAVGDIWTEAMSVENDLSTLTGQG